MTLQVLTQRQHALAAVLILCVVLTFFITLVVAPAMLLRRELTYSIVQLETTLQSYKAAALTIDPLQIQIHALSMDRTNSGDYLQETTPALAAAELQNYVKGIIESHQGTLLSAQPMADPQNELFPKVTIKIALRGTLNDLQQILYQLESAQPRLFIDNLLIQSRTPLPTPTHQKEADTLEVRFDVNGYTFAART